MFWNYFYLVLLLTPPTLKLHSNYCTYTITMSTLMNQLTIEQAHKELNSLADKIAAKYEQLDCGKFGTVGTPGFNAKPAELACMFVCMSQLFHRLNRLLFFKN